MSSIGVPSWFEESIIETALPAPDNAVASTEPPKVAVRSVHELSIDYGILFG